MQKYQQEGSIVFYAHPLLHGFPWRVRDSISNKHVMKAIKQQPFARYKESERNNQKLLDGLKEKMETSSWQRAVMEQTPSQLWEHRNELTEYQVWVAYRVAVRQLNLYFDGREHDNACRKLEECRGHKETLEHILWECPCARACWVKLIQLDG
jgi:7-cyano-7-deazaguanine synthase in queuosine biosynthesis